MKKKSHKKLLKKNFEDRYSLMVAEYQEEKSLLDALIEGTAEYNSQKTVCDRLFSAAERYINKQ